MELTRGAVETGRDLSLRGGAVLFVIPAKAGMTVVSTFERGGVFQQQPHMRPLLENIAKVNLEDSSLNDRTI